ncbi:MAG: T9SS type A sorting domain-containing protein [Marinoscillum sp.]|uniref:T9SS type A sorting domain-containing protein n=1 Tax=Marinoscillum sp. TaxID=2024838 RepID=UPI0032F63F56
MFKELGKFFIGFMLSVIGFGACATHISGGYISIKKVEGTTVTLRVIGFSEAASSVHFGHGVLSFGDGTVNSAEVVVTRKSISDHHDLVSFEVVHAYAGPGAYTVSYSKDMRTDGILNVTNSVSESFYIETSFVIDPFFQNSFPQFDASHLLLAANMNRFTQAVQASDSDGDLLVFSLVTPRKARDMSVSGYHFAGAEVDPFTGNMSWDVGNHASGQESLYTFAVQVQEMRKQEDNWLTLSRTILDFNVEIVPSVENHPTIESVLSVCEAEAFYLELQQAGQCSLEVDLPFYQLADGSQSTSLNGLSVQGDTVFHFDLIASAKNYDYGHVRVYSEDYVQSRNVFYSHACESLTAIRELVTGVPLDSQEISLYPNPSDGDFKINDKSGNLSRYKIITLSGKQIYTGMVQNPLVSLSHLGNLQPGTYVIQFFDGFDRLIGVEKLLIVE